MQSIDTDRFQQMNEPSRENVWLNRNMFKHMINWSFQCERWVVKFWCDSKPKLKIDFSFLYFPECLEAQRFVLIVIRAIKQRSKPNAPNIQANSLECSNACKCTFLECIKSHLRHLIRSRLQGQSCAGIRRKGTLDKFTPRIDALHCRYARQRMDDSE